MGKMSFPSVREAEAVVCDRQSFVVPSRTAQRVFGTTAVDTGVPVCIDRRSAEMYQNALSKKARTSGWYERSRASRTHLKSEPITVDSLNGKFGMACDRARQYFIRSLVTSRSHLIRAPPLFDHLCNPVSIIRQQLIKRRAGAAFACENLNVLLTTEFVNQCVRVVLFDCIHLMKNRCV